MGLLYLSPNVSDICENIWRFVQAYAGPECASQNTVLLTGLFTSELSHSHDSVQRRCHANITGSFLPSFTHHELTTLT